VTAAVAVGIFFACTVFWGWLGVVMQLHLSFWFTLLLATKLGLAV